MAQVMRDAVARIADACCVPAPLSSAAVEGGCAGVHLRQLVDADLLPAGTTIVTRDAQPQTAQVLPDGRLYADGEPYDTLLELSEGLKVNGNPWSAWAAELADGRVALNELREASRRGMGLRPEAVSRRRSVPAIGIDQQPIPFRSGGVKC